MYMLSVYTHVVDVICIYTGMFAYVYVRVCISCRHVYVSQKHMSRIWDLAVHAMRIYKSIFVTMCN